MNSGRVVPEFLVKPFYYTAFTAQILSSNANYKGKN